MSRVAIWRDVERLCAPELAGRGSYQPGGAAAARYIEEEFRAAGLETVRQSVAGSADTVIGILRAGERSGGPGLAGANDPGARAVIVSAHYDHLGRDSRGTVYPGADDNASGTAVLLALARAAAGRRYEHTVLFISFAAEEEGLVGSGVYVASPVWPLDRTLAVINFDMVGRDFFEAGADQPEAAGVVGLDEIAGAREAAERAAGEAGLKLIPVPARLVELFGFHDRTDDWWFRRRGVPSVHFSTGLHADYHQPTDTPGKLVPAQMERIARTAYGLLGFVARDGRRGRTLRSGLGVRAQLFAHRFVRDGLAHALDETVRQDDHHLVNAAIFDQFGLESAPFAAVIVAKKLAYHLHREIALKVENHVLAQIRNESLHR